MERVLGRTADFLLRKDGSRVAGISLIENTLTQYPGIGQMQIIQDSINVIRLNIVAGDGYSEQIEKALVSYFKGVFGTDTVIDIIKVPCIQPEESGKYRFSICKVRNV